MTFAISREVMEWEFGAEHLVTVPADRLNRAVSHAPTARFLSEVGLPDVRGIVFWIDREAASGLESVLDRIAYLGRHTGEALGDWVVIGTFMGDEFLLDGADGAVWIHIDGEATVKFVSSGLDLFARFVAAFHRDRYALHPDYNTPDEIATAMNNLVEDMREYDPVALEHKKTCWQTLPDRVAWQY